MMTRMALDDMVVGPFIATGGIALLIETCATRFASQDSVIDAVSGYNWTVFAHRIESFDPHDV